MQWDTVVKILSSPNDAVIDAKLRDLNAAFGDGRALAEVREVALNDRADLKQRKLALQLLVDLRDPEIRGLCEKLIRVRGLSATAAAGLALVNDESVADVILNEWPAMYGDERPGVMSAMCRDRCLPRSFFWRWRLGRFSDRRSVFSRRDK